MTRCCVWTQTREAFGVPCEKMRVHPSALRSQGSSVHGNTRPELGFLLPGGRLRCICWVQSFLKGGGPCSELVLSEALSRFRRRLRAELGSEAQSRFRVNRLLGGGWRVRKMSERKSVSAVTACLQWKWGVLGGEQSWSLSSCKSWWCSRLPGCDRTSFSGQHSAVALFNLG